MENWIKADSEQNDIVLSSRIRLARNLEKIPFPDKLETEKAKEIVKQVEDAFYVNLNNKEKYKTVYLLNEDNISNNTFLEKHLVSPKLISNASKSASAFILNKDETVSIMINEEDHLRIQCITAGLNLEEAFKEANGLDDMLEQKLNYAFHEKLGYLTACPTNLGTGLRASIMIHLPALVMENEIDQVLSAISHLGMTIRGIYGEGSKSEGNLFQISNQITLGISEKEIVANLIAIIKQIINQENMARDRIIKKYRYEIEDKIYRALGILRSAVLLDSKECLKLLSYVRMGVEMGIITDVNKKILNDLLVSIQPAILQKNSKINLSQRERDLNRAKLVKEKLRI
ncbi:protein arginine kinase [Haloimpatiens sp. FM7330]|uniref:protein arginine kinase n=1 Tax=Haloimpatiens sp. FM7330 TaxID=3298610 RepID=UPI00363EE59E